MKASIPIISAVVIAGLLSGCGNNPGISGDVAQQTSLQTEESTLVTEKETTKTETTQTETTTEPEPEIVASYDLTGEGDLEDGFSEGRCWIKFKNDGEEHVGIIDDSGRLIYKYTHENNADYCRRSTRFQSGVACQYSLEGKFFLIDSDGNILYESPDKSDTEIYDFIGQYKDKFVIEKHIKTFSENSYYLQIIDKNGKVISEYKTDDTSGNRGFEKISEGVYTVGNNLILKFDPCEIIPYDDTEYVEDYRIVGTQYISDDGTVIAEKSDYFAGGLEFLEYYECKNVFDKEGETGYYNIQGELVVRLPEFPEGVEIDDCSEFRNGEYATLKIRGADGYTYATIIDKNGQIQYEPIKIKAFYYGIENINGYILVILPDEERISVITPKGTILVLGVDDCSELGSDAVFFDSYHYFISDGFIRMDAEMKKAHGIESTGVGFVSLDGKTTITTADVYSDSELARDIIPDESSTSPADSSSSTGSGVTSLNGTYSAEVLGGIAKSYFTFNGDNITMSAFGIEADGTYRINNNKLYINYSMFGKEYNIDYSFRQDGNRIYIGGDEFIKE